MMAVPERKLISDTAPMAKRRCVLVLGMHRSGTSALTRLFNLMGADISRVILPPKADNESGFWESKTLMRIHEKMMASAGMHWDDITRFPARWFGSDTAKRFQSEVLSVLRSDFSDSPLFVIKDPRMCRLMPFWYAVLEAFETEPLCALIIRNPLEVAESLRTRNDFSLEKSLMMWLWHVLEAEYYSRSKRRSVVAYSQLLSDWRAVMNRVQADLHLELPRASAQMQVEVNRFLSHGQKHHTASLDMLDTREDVTVWVKDVYRIFSAAAQGQPIPFEALDGIRDALMAADAAYGPVISDSFSRIHQQEDALETLQQEVAAHTAVTEGLRSELALRDAAITQLRDEISKLSDANAYKDEEMAKKEAAIDHFRNEIQAWRNRFSEQRTEQENHLAARIDQLEEKLLRFSVIQPENEQALQVKAAAAEPSPMATPIQPVIRKRPQWRERGLVVSRKIRRAFRLQAWARLAKRWRFTEVTQAIRSTGLFDEKFYVENNPDIAAAGLDPVLHYVMYGAAEGRNPHPLFDSRYYWSRNPEVAQAGINPLYHFWIQGAASGCNPHPGFDLAWYTAAYPEVREAGINPLVHYTREGAGKGYRPLPPFGYAEWVQRFDTLSETDRFSIRNRMDALSWQPLFSVILLVSDSITGHARQAVTSLFAQLYSNWELFIASSSGEGLDSNVLPQLLPSSDPRVRTPLDAAGTPDFGINACVSAARGDYVLLLNDDCRLAEAALLSIAVEVNRHPNAAILYSDHDHLDAADRRTDPYFKPDWNIDLFYGTDYLGGLVVLKQFYVSRTGGFQPVYGAAQVYDMVLRVAQQSPFKGVRHIPHVLFHCHTPVHPVSPDLCEAKRRVLTDYFSRGQRDAVIEPLSKWFNRVIWPMPDTAPLVSVIISTRDRADLLSVCVESILQKTDYPSYEILIIDNNSEDPKTLAYLDQLRKNESIKIFPYPYAFNYSAIHNWAVKKARGDIFCFLNNDTQVIDPRWLTEMVRHVLRKGVGVVGAKLFYPNDTLQHAGVIVGKHGIAGHALAGLPRGRAGYFGRALLTQELSSVTAACMVTKRHVFEAVSGFDEKAFVIAFNDVDYCLKVRTSGWRVIWAAEAQLYHHESVTVGPPDSPGRVEQFGRESRAFFQRWRRIVHNDPFYNPNLSLQNDYELGNPPRVKKPWAGKSVEGDAVAVPRDRRLALYAGVNNLRRSQAVTEPGKLLPPRSFQAGLSIIILNLEQFQLIGPLLDDLTAAKKELAGENMAIDILVGDTGSRDKRVLDKYAELAAEITVEKNLSYHFSRCNNRMFERHVRFDQTLFLNNDIIFDNAAGSLRCMMHQMLREPHTGVLGCHLLYPDGLIQHSGIDFFQEGTLKGLCFHPFHRQPDIREQAVGEAVPVPAVTGACLVTRSSLFEALGGFDEGYQSECQDVALCLALKRLGHRCVLLNAGKIVHIENATRKADSEDWRDRSRFMRQWANFVGV